MKNVTLLNAFLIFSFLYFSCQKTNRDPVAEDTQTTDSSAVIKDSIRLVVAVLSNGKTNTYNFEYDSTNRPVHYYSTIKNGDDDHYIIKYNHDKIDRVIYQRNERYGVTHLMPLFFEYDGNGKCYKIWQKPQTGGKDINDSYFSDRSDSVYYQKYFDYDTILYNSYGQLIEFRQMNTESAITLPYAMLTIKFSYLNNTDHLVTQIEKRYGIPRQGYSNEKLILTPNNIINPLYKDLGFIALIEGLAPTLSMNYLIDDPASYMGSYVLLSPNCFSSYEAYNDWSGSSNYFYNRYSYKYSADSTTLDILGSRAGSDYYMTFQFKKVPVR